MDAQIQRIKSDQLVEKIILTKADALVHISPDFSGTGQIQNSTLKELATFYKGRIDFFSVDYDANSALSLTFRLNDMPTLLFFKQGRLVDKLSGLIHRSTLSNRIQQLLTSLN